MSTRSAAIGSIKSFRSALCWSQGKVNVDFLGLWLCVYNALVDDDEEIRDEAAKIIAYVVPLTHLSGEAAFRGTPSLTPVAALDWLLDHFAMAHKASSSLCIEALSRATGCVLSSRIPQGRVDAEYPTAQSWELERNLKPIANMLEQAIKPNTTLFMEEKQNLFIDEVQETERWTGILKSLSSMAVSSSLIPILETWVVQGLRALIETAKAQEGGPLGWTSKAEVFLLGMRILAMADVLLDWGQKAFGVADLGGIWIQLEELAEVGHRRGLHGLWMAKVGGLLQGRHTRSRSEQ